MPGPSAVPIVLSENERAELVRRARGPGRWRADRARIILACAEGMSNAGAAQALGVAVKSVSKWRRQFAANRLAGLEDAAPVGRRKAELVLTDEERAQLARWARRAKTAQFLALRWGRVVEDLVLEDTATWEAASRRLAAAGDIEAAGPPLTAQPA